MKKTRNNILDNIEDIPLDTSVKVVVHLELINLIHDMGLRESGYWTDNEHDNRLMNIINRATLSITDRVMEEIDLWNNNNKLS